MEVQLSKNFVLSEFHCRDGTRVPSMYYDNLKTLVYNLQMLRDCIEKPIIILSGYRTIEHNKAVNGSRKSYHLTAQAADFIVPSIMIETLHEIVGHLIRNGSMKPGGLGLYDTFIHYDTRGYNSRWML